MRCKNCGAEYDDLEPQCPFCKTFNYQGAENQYMEKLEDIRSDLEELDDAPMDAYRSQVKHHLRFAAKIVIGILAAVALLFLCGWGINRWQEMRWESDHEKVLQWYDENLPQMNRWYDAGDLAALSAFHQSLGDEEYTAFYSWDHADVIFSYECYENILAVQELAEKGEASETDLSGAMYDAFSLIYFPGNDFQEEHEQELLAQFQEAGWQLLRETLGFTKESAEAFYKENSEYDVLSYRACEAYVKKRP